MKLPLFVGIFCSLIVLGAGMYVTDFTVYLGHDPTTCNNCHVMDYVYEGWFHSGHKQWANCIDCHTPEGLIPMYLYKTKSGVNHVTHFTFGTIPDPIRAKEDTLEITQYNCVRCHRDAVSNINYEMKDGVRCVSCHRDIPHGLRGWSSYPYQDIIYYEEAVNHP